MALNTAWAMERLDHFLQLTATYRPEPRQGYARTVMAVRNRGSEAEIVDQAEIVEKIFDRVVPDWRRSYVEGRPNRLWSSHVEVARRALSTIRHEEELKANLGDGAPQLAASSLHPWIWEGARSLWQSGHHREAVGAAAIKLNAETQNKLGRRDISEGDLFNQAFSTEDPKPGAPRLRLTEDDNSKTFTSLHRGVRAFAEGCFAAIRNPISHTEGELPEPLALEQLAAFSVLARWVDDAARRDA